jgi:hypothetical protein|tara:strand:+ start:1148 stop:2350 length:1203 start_codon:yes stop_codon:yes gene_type:complete
MGAKNLHLEHLEDEIINQGIDGGRGAINFLQGLRDMLKGNSNSSVNMTVKWDGAPAIFCGKHPETGQFFVAKKSLFNKTPLFYTSEKEINDASELSGQLKEKFLTSFKYLSKLSWNTIMQGDLMYTNDKKMTKIDGKSFITFQPNTIMYAVDIDSKLGKTIASSKMGIVFHTTYSGSTIEDLGASFGANTSSLGSSSDVWVDDATYKDVSGNSTMTAKETLKLTQVLSGVGKSFHGITKKDLQKFMELQSTINQKGAGASYKTYCNAQIRGGSFKPTYAGYMKHFENYWRDKVVGKVKMEKTKEIKREIGEQLYNELRALNKFITNLTKFMEGLVVAKQIIIVALNRVKSIGTFKKTATGFEVVNPEGYVAIDKTGSAVKLVDRMEFAYNNFTAQKNWDK